VMASPPDEAAPQTIAGITPRWEWRTFGDDLGAADDVLARSVPERTEHSDERYLVPARGEASVKVRDDLLDVKALLEVDEHGLQLWAPNLKAELPLSAHDLEVLLGALDVDPPSPVPASTTLDELLADVLGERPDVAVLEVRKERTHHLVDGCMVESSQLTADGSTTRTISVESPDPAEVVATVAALGLAGRRNVSVVAHLKALVGFGTRRHLVLDVGTNSVKYHLGERRSDGTSHTLVDRSAVTRLGEGQSDSGELAEPAIARTVEAIVAMVEEARRSGPVDIVAVGTAGLRRAPNRAVLVDAVHERTGVTVEVISGEEEARLAFLAATSALPAANGRLAVFDTGGGSSQFTFGHDDRVDEQFSVYVGAVRTAERFGLESVTTADTLGAALAWLSSELSDLDDRPQPDVVVGIGGGVTNLAAVKHALPRYDPDVVHATVLDVAELDRQIERYRTSTTDERREIVGLQPARAEVILAGACIVRTILAKLGRDSFTVSDRGLRHGVEIARFGS
jgi:exopolyphosphatase/guanosine-5'-triphosphate,3'-diphosphate pyrophosphatase